MHTMNATYHVMKQMVALTLIALLVGTRLFCDLGTTLSPGQCCAQSDCSTPFKSEIAGRASHEDHECDCPGRPAETPKSSRSDQCCTNWFVFAAGPIKVSTGRDSQRPLAEVGMVPATMPPNDPISIRCRSAYPIVHNRAPNNPLCLASHPIRV